MEKLGEDGESYMVEANITSSKISSIVRDKTDDISNRNFEWCPVKSVCPSPFEGWKTCLECIKRSRDLNPARVMFL